MKKKLVAFAVTAAMIITSAVPVFAEWKPDGTPTIDMSKNQVVATSAQKDGVVNSVSGQTEFSATVDLNKTIGDFEYVLQLTDGKSTPVVEDLAKIIFGSTNNGKAKIYAWSETSGADAIEVGDVQGIVTLTWSVDIANGNVTIKVNDHGKTQTDAEYTATLKTKAGVVQANELRLNARDITAYADDKAPIAEGNQVAFYQNAVPEDVVAVEVINAKTNEVATQPVAGESYTVKSITLDDGTVIEGTDIKKYVNITWTAVNAKGEDKAANASDRNYLTFKVKDGDYDGCLITVTVKGNKVSGIFDEAAWGADSDALATKDRIAGENRYETAMKVADKVKAQAANKDGFKYVIVTTGTNYADALSATALAKKLSAPILLADGSYEADVKAYIDDNAKSFSDTQIVIIGGTSAVSQNFEDSLYKYKNITRIEGANRYQTNVAILKAYLGKESDETGLGTANGTISNLVVATGTDFADALSVSSTGVPVLLVDGSLKPVQTAFLKELGDKSAITYTIVGGVNAVPKSIEKALASKDYSTAVKVERIGGTDRYQTNKKVVEKWFKTGDAYNANLTNVYVASGTGFADALTGGALAAQTGTSPMVLVSEGHTNVAKNIVAGVQAKNPTATFIVIGGENAVSNELVQKIA